MVTPLNKTNISEFVEQWRSRGEKSFPLLSEEDRAEFYEAASEMIKHIAMVSRAASMELSVNDEGVTKLTIHSIPS